VRKTVLKCEIFNLLEPLGPVKACNGIVLSVIYMVMCVRACAYVLGCAFECVHVCAQIRPAQIRRAPVLLQSNYYISLRYLYLRSTDI
jgi:hypothetical protein